MAEVVGPNGSVIASEVDPDLAARARENLSSYSNVTVHAGDGSEFDPGECDAMLINAGVTHPHELWLDRLRNRGRLVLPITLAISKTIGSGVMIKITREGDGFSARVSSPVAIFNCTSVRNPELEPQLRKALQTQTLFKVKSLRRDAHDQTDTCLVHASGVCLSTESRLFDS